MSLKAKLEAVIYAAEEPVTLAQLAALFAEEALAWKAERAAANAEAAAQAAEPLPALKEGFGYLELDADSDVALPGETPAAAPEAATPAAEAAEPTPAATGTASSAEAETPAGTPAGASADPEAEQKREARARDREVRGILEDLLAEMIAAQASDDRGIEIREIAGGYRMATKPEYHDAVRGFIRSLKPPLKLSLQALETLAVVAYKQPVTAPEVSEIRGVESAGTLGSLLSRKLIATAGRKQVIGRPILYKTTREFLLRFGLKDVSELPSMEEFEKMAAIELDEDTPGEEAAAEASEAGEAILDENAEAGGETGGAETEVDAVETAPAEAAPASEPAGAEAPTHEH